MLHDNHDDGSPRPLLGERRDSILRPSGPVDINVDEHGNAIEPRIEPKVPRG